MSNQLTLDDFPILSNSANVKYKDKDALLKKINNIVRDGTEKLQIVTDFDSTITKQHVNGTPHLSSFCMFAESKQLPSNFKEKDIERCKKYIPIEMDPHIPMDEKLKAMEEWYGLTQNSLRGYEFDPNELEQVVENCGADLRDGTKNLFVKLCEAKVPVLVFSAGLGDVVEMILRQNGVLFENVEIISNFLKYSGKSLDGFKGKIIHTLNKNETVLDEEHLRRLEKRKNIILMGDNAGDVSMCDGMRDVDNVLKIGFLYNKDNKIVERNLKHYMEVFDVVLIDDQTMDLPWSILKRLE